MEPFGSSQLVLEPGKRSADVVDFEMKLRSKVIGQEDAVNEMVSMFQVCTAGISAPGRPVISLLFLGPTGSGKTYLVEAVAEILFDRPKAFTKIDCAEFQHSHEIAKLIGSPPGYLGHRETPPILTQTAIDQFQTERVKLSFVLFDEIEKAHDALWQLLLGILDKAKLTLGDNRQVDFSRCVIVMTSNLGAMEMSRFQEGGIGFAPAAGANSINLDHKINQVALEAAKRRFSPEFMNRIDKIAVFRTLATDHLKQILEIELKDLFQRILAAQPYRTFKFQCSSEVKAFLLREGTDLKYGARHLKRAIERHLVYPLSNLIATDQIRLGDEVMADLSSTGEELVFSKTAKAEAYAMGMSS